MCRRYPCESHRSTNKETHAPLHDAALQPLHALLQPRVQWHGERDEGQACERGEAQEGEEQGEGEEQDLDAAGDHVACFGL